MDTQDDWPQNEKSSEVGKSLPLMCKLFGHRMYFDSCDVSGPSTCKRKGCGHKHAAIEWPRPPMPKCKPPITEGSKKGRTKGNQSSGRPVGPPNIKTPTMGLTKLDYVILYICIFVVGMGVGSMLTEIL